MRDIEDRHPATSALLTSASVEDILREGAETFTPREWLTIGAAVNRAADDPGVDAIVVTHGTYAAEETAYFLHLTARTSKPIVIVCSQRKHDALGNDGDRNLIDALRVYCSPQHTGTRRARRAARGDPQRARGHEDESAAGRLTGGPVRAPR